MSHEDPRHFDKCDLCGGLISSRPFSADPEGGLAHISCLVEKGYHPAGRKLEPNEGVFADEDIPF